MTNKKQVPLKKDIWVQFQAINDDVLLPSQDVVWDSQIIEVQKSFKKPLGNESSQLEKMLSEVIRNYKKPQ